MATDYLREVRPRFGGDATSKGDDDSGMTNGRHH